MNRLKTLTIAALALFVSLPATADFYYKARTWQEGDQAAKEADMTVEAYVNGGQADIRFLDSGNPFMAEGNRLVTKNDVRDLYLVNDEEKTVQPFQLDAVLAMANDIMKSMGPMVKIKVENVSVETLLTEPGGKLLGYDTTHTRYRTSYDLTFKVIGIGNTQHVETIQDIWSTTQIDDPAMGVWLVRDPPDFGDSGLAELIELEQQKVKGYPLKTVIEQVTAGKKKKNESRTVTITEVQILDERAAPAGAYTWPADYQVQPGMTPDQMAGGQPANDDQPEEEEEGDKKGWRSKLPFGKKKGG